MLRISLASPVDMHAFRAFLRVVHVAVVDVDETTVGASIPGAQTELHERRELTGYVVTWNALHPGQTATLES